MRKISLLLCLNTIALLGQSQIKVPELYFAYDWRGKLIDMIGYNLTYIGLTGFSKVDNQLIQDFEKDFPSFQKQWIDMGTTLFQEVYFLFKRGFKQESRTAILSLGSTGGYGSTNILFIGIHSLLDTQKQKSKTEERFVNLLFHELLHIWIDDNFNAELSYFLQKYKNAPQNVREHIHLMAIQKMVYITLRRDDMLDIFNEEYSNVAFSDYNRAWHIVNNIEDYNDIVNDVLHCLVY